MSTDKDTPPVFARGLLRSTSAMSVGTLLSRILGFVRDILFARFFGTAAGADAFVTAFRLPNLFRDIMGEGAANSALVPVMTEYRQKRPQELSEFLGVTFFWAFLILSGITLIGIIFAPQLVRLVAPGFAADPGKMELTVTLTRLMFPYLILIGLTAFFSAVQFTHGSFMAPAFGPALMNIVLIVSTVVSVWLLSAPIYGLAVGVLAGGVVQYVFQQEALKRKGVHWGRPLTLKNEGARRVGRLILPRVAGSAVYQLNVFVDTICASLSTIVGAGGISAIYYATRLIQLPMGIFAVALATASLPALSGHAVFDRKDEFKKTLVFSLENVLFVMVPASVFFVCFADVLVRVLFQRGAFDGYSTYVTASALVFYSLGLTGFGAARILSAAFHALQDTRTPVVVAFICLAVNAALNIILMFPMKLSGIALASAVASGVNVILLLQFLQKRLGPLPFAFSDFFVKVLSASAFAAACAWCVLAWRGMGSEVFRLLLASAVFAAAYFGMARVFRMEQAKQAGRLFRR